MLNRIPGGVLHKGTETEFFSVITDNTVEAYGFNSGIKYAIADLPKLIKKILIAGMKSVPAIEKGIEDMVGIDEAIKLSKFVACRYGALNTDPDIDEEGILSEPEYVPCPFRGSCKHEGVVCCSIKIGNAVLSKSETEVFKLVNMEDTEIAEKLFISPKTVRTHFQNIRHKTGFTNKMEMAIWATQKGII